jgi:hypothetical protein
LRFASTCARRRPRGPYHPDRQPGLNQQRSVSTPENCGTASWHPTPTTGQRNYNTLVFDSREAAERRATDVRGNAANQTAFGIILENVTVAEVLAHAETRSSADTSNTTATEAGPAG